MGISENSIPRCHFHKLSQTISQLLTSYEKIYQVKMKFYGSLTNYVK